VFDAPPPLESAGTPAPRRDRTLTTRPARSFSDDTLEGLIDRSMDATLQASADVKILVDMLQLLLQRYRVQLLRLQNEVAEARAERSQIQREVERGRLVLEVEHELGPALADRVRGLADFDLRLTTARDGHLEFQVL
jgi:hypothetical protein